MATPTRPPAAAALRGAIDLAPLVQRSAQPPAAPAQARPPAPGEPVTEGVVFEAGDADFGKVVDLSGTVPVIVAIVAGWSTPSQELVPALTKAVEAHAGRIALAIVDHDANPQLRQAFQAQAVPTVAAVIAGGPVSLFQGGATDEQLAALLPQVLQLAEQNGVQGVLGTGPVTADEEAPAAPLPPHHAEAYAAIEAQDYETAAREFRTAIAQDPRDQAAVAALAQVELLRRLATADPATVRAAAGSAPKDVDAQLAVADLDVAGGHLDDAFDRLLDLFAIVGGDDRTAIRTRLLDYFEIAGPDDPRVGAARRRLTTLLF